MIPNFTHDGILPEGVHECTLEEFEKRFASTYHRRELFEGILKLIAHLKQVKCTALYVDGSYVTNKLLPNDFDACWDNRNVDLALVKQKVPVLFDTLPPRKAQKQIYGGDIFPAFITEQQSKRYFIDFFQIDKRTGQKKGIVKLRI
ncbi:MAG: hypothetical protein U0V74_01500 [Chitinophagales bacterium]